MTYAVIEANGQDIQSVNVFSTNAEAIGYAISLAADNEATEDMKQLQEQFADPGHWDQGEWRISVVCIDN